MNDDGTTTRTKWAPSKEQLDAYLAREVEMARANIANMPTSAIASCTLHSQRTLALAMAPKP